jgi:hypothetical protein
MAEPKDFYDELIVSAELNFQFERFSFIGNFFEKEIQVIGVELGKDFRFIRSSDLEVDTSFADSEVTLYKPNVVLFDRNLH